MLKHKKTIMLCALLLLVVSICISLVLINTTLDIKGKMKVSSANWNIQFENLKEPVITGGAVELTKPQLTDKSTSIENLNVKIQRAGGEIAYIFDVANHGGLDAEVSSIQISNPICIGNGDESKKDAALVCKNIRYNLTYENGSKINIGDSLNEGETKTLKLSFSYVGGQLPENEVDVNNLNLAIIYTQK